MVTVSHIVSLGGSCRVTHNLRSYFDFSSAYPFDWWITPLRSATRFLREPDLDRLYEPGSLQIVKKEGSPSTVWNIHFGIDLHHEFPRSDGEVAAGFLNHIEAPRARQRYLLKRLRDLNEERHSLLLVRHFIWTDRGLSLADMAAFTHAAEEMFDRAECRFLFINCPIEFRRDDIMQLRISERPDISWRGDSRLWAEGLASLNLDYRPVEQSRYEGSDPTAELRKAAAD